MADQVQTGAAARGGDKSPFRVAKSGQGIHVRWGTAMGAFALAVSGAYFLWDKLALIRVFEQADATRSAVVVVALAAAAYLIFWLVGRKQGVINFLIATEGEMKKVNWSSRREVWGATRVVIVTVLALAAILFSVNIICMVFFSGIGVLKFNVLTKLFGGTT